MYEYGLVEALRKATLEDLQMENVPHVFWE